MFDWNEEGLVDMIWGEDGDNGDHIVPYPKGTEENRLFVSRDISKKQGNQENAAVVKPAEQKTSGTKNDSPGNQKNNFQAKKSEELLDPRNDIDLWPDFPIPIGGGKACADRNGWDSMSTEFSNSFIKDNSLDPIKDDMITEFCDSKGIFGNDDSTSMKKSVHLSTTDTILQNDPGLFGNGDNDKGSRSFLDYGWDSIGNLDDFDRIFRNDDSMLGHEMVGNSDELWSSSADEIYCQTQSFPVDSASPNTGFKSLRTKPEQGEVKLESASYKNQALPSDFKKVDESVAGRAKITSEEKAEDGTETTAETITFQSQLSSGIRKHFKDKGNRQRKLLKRQKKPGEKNKTRSLNGPLSLSRDQIQPFVNMNRHNSATSAVPAFPSRVLNVPLPTGGPESMSCLPTSSSYLQAGYGYPSHHFSIVPQLSQIYSDRDQSQLVVDSYVFSPETLKYGSPMQKPPDVHSRAVAMTPREKIEKLRRRQQIQAMLAIQQQQQQFGHQAAYTDSAVTKRFPQEYQEQDANGSKTEMEENSEPAVGQDDSSKSSVLVNEQSLEETIFYQLQSAIVKLDSKIRLWIQDSLFRLARSAAQRRNISDTSSTNKSSRDENEVVANEETNRHDRSIRLCDIETDTNPIDRTVAQLLFHRSSEPCGKRLNDGLPESPISCNLQKFPGHSRIEGCMKPNVECISERLNDKKSISHYKHSMSVDPQQGYRLQSIL